MSEQSNRDTPSDSNRFSKLTLSSSLHQLHMNEPNIITTNRHNRNNHHHHHHLSLDIENNDSHTTNAAQTPSNKHQTSTNVQSTLSSIHEQHQSSGLEQYETNYETNSKHLRLDLDSNQNCVPPSAPITTNVKPKLTNKTIAAIKSKQKDANLDTVHIVVGNEACDLDSAVSCLLMFHIVSKMSDEISGKDKSRTLYVPLLNINRDMLDSKCEVIWFLQKTLCIDKSFLTCKDDIDWKEIKRNGIEVLITLVDHNYNEEFAKIGKIVEIVDHHQIQNHQWFVENHSSMRTTIDTSVGSCTTLIAEKLFYIYAEHHVADEILLLIYGTVLLDTICLSEKAKRFTRRDVYLLKKLDSLLGSKKPSRTELYKSLVEVKNNNRELNFDKLMKRDLKVYNDSHGYCIGIASLFGMAAKEALGLSANIDLDNFFSENKYIAFVIMGLIADAKNSDSISRDMVLVSANDNLFSDLCKVFESESSNLELVIVPSNLNDPEECPSTQACTKPATPVKFDPASSMSLMNYNVRIWNQQNVSSSRKVVAPLVLKVLHNRSAMEG